MAHLLGLCSQQTAWIRHMSFKKSCVLSRHDISRNVYMSGTSSAFKRTQESLETYHQSIFLSSLCNPSTPVSTFFKQPSSIRSYPSGLYHLKRPFSSIQPEDKIETGLQRVLRIKDETALRQLDDFLANGNLSDKVRLSEIMDSLFKVS